MVKAGADVISVSVADPFPYISPLSDSPHGTYVALAEAVKQRVGALVIGVGRINSVELAEEILSQGRVDLVGVGRQLIADPFWPQKAAQGRISEITPCLSCNSCVDAAFVSKGVGRCVVNPIAGQEAELEIKPVEQSKRVFIIGGGPAGMEAAKYAKRLADS